MVSSSFIRALSFPTFLLFKLSPSHASQFSTELGSKNNEINKMKHFKSSPKKCLLRGSRQISNHLQQSVTMADRMRRVSQEPLSRKREGCIRAEN